MPEILDLQDQDHIHNYAYIGTLLPHSQQDVFALGTPDVVARIEELATQFVTCLNSGSIMGMQLMVLQSMHTNRAGADGNTVAEQGGSSLVLAGLQPFDGGGAAAAASRPHVRTLFANNGAGAMAYARVFLVLQAVHELLRDGRTTTQRDLYYKLQCPPVIASAKDIDAAIQDISRILAVPRAALGVTCASRGAVVGRVYVRDTPASPWQDCTACGIGGKAIPGDMQAIDSISFQTSASYLLIVEKDAIFQRLSQDRLFDALPVIMVTARGMPDLATRAFCSKLVEGFPLTVLGFVDYNPAGVIILRTYKFGSQRSNMESPRYAMPTLYWLGLHSRFLTNVTTEHLQELTPRDRSLLPNLRSSFLPGASPLKATQTPAEVQAGIDAEHCEHLEQWVGELDIMDKLGYKADIEAMYSLGGYGGLRDMVVNAILRKQYI